ncbi:Flp pilus assembly complex ATPase component TadA [Candidatus Desantisbacteria bacterium]|nr:Flp pilus assembly complex ATPase component TadA [Candidatus Desantisbacteria bacterium]
MDKLHHLKITDILIEEGLITNAQLEEAVQKQKDTSVSLEEILIKSNMVDKNTIMTIKADLTHTKYIDIVSYSGYDEFAHLLSEVICRRYHLICINKIGNRLSLVMSNPLDIFSLDNLRLVSGYEIEPLLGYAPDIDLTINQIFGYPELPEEAIEEPNEEDKNLQNIASAMSGLEIQIEKKKKEEAPVIIDTPLIRLVDGIIIQAIEKKASDIHIEAFENIMKVRYRIDGIMQEIMKFSKSLQPSIISRIKIMSGLNITEKRLPQDGRLNIILKKKAIDMRISILPTIAGEGVVIRILDRSSITLGLDEIGLSPNIAEGFKAAVSQSNGMVMVTGPTGSGKTTTLYAALNTLNAPTKKIVTVEDPVEYYLDGINQVQVRPNIGFTFASGLRAFFRQDPDIIMVGEIRDFETAQTAIEAALTGHLVLSTLHTNDAVGTVTRLMDMGIEPFLISSTLRCVLAQRLIRANCSRCKEPINPSNTLLRLMDKMNIPLPDNVSLFKGKGCKACHETGYKGRIGIFELLTMSTELEDMIANRSSGTQMLEVAKRHGLKTLLEDGIEKVFSGLTTIEEVFRVAQG